MCDWKWKHFVKCGHSDILRPDDPCQQMQAWIQSHDPRFYGRRCERPSDDSSLPIVEANHDEVCKECRKLAREDKKLKREAEAERQRTRFQVAINAIVAAGVAAAASKTPGAGAIAPFIDPLRRWQTLPATAESIHQAQQGADVPRPTSKFQTLAMVMDTGQQGPQRPGTPSESRPQFLQSRYLPRPAIMPLIAMDPSMRSDIARAEEASRAERRAIQPVGLNPRQGEWRVGYIMRVMSDYNLNEEQALNEYLWRL